MMSEGKKIGDPLFFPPSHIMSSGPNKGKLVAAPPSRIDLSLEAEPPVVQYEVIEP